MIKVGILGGSTPQAGELIRLLVNHPDVSITGVEAPELGDRDIKSVHHGLIGECALKFTDTLPISELDVLFVTLPKATSRAEVPSPAEAPELFVIDVTGDFESARKADPLMVYGVPELSRKALVRGSRRAVIPSVVETLSAIALLPLAQRSMLPEHVQIDIDADPQTGFSVPDSFPFLETLLTREDMSRDIKPFFEVHPSDTGRVVRLSVDLQVPVPIDNIMSLYEEIYEDHNLTHIVGEAVDSDEVEGTDKVIVSLDKGSDGLLQIRAIADAGLRGGAGDAVHIMNLLTGLYERTGLELKAHTLL